MKSAISVEMAGANELNKNLDKNMKMQLISF